MSRPPLSCARHAVLDAHMAICIAKCNLLRRLISGDRGHPERFVLGRAFGDTPTRVLCGPTCRNTTPERALERREAAHLRAFCGYPFGVRRRKVKGSPGVHHSQRHALPQAGDHHRGQPVRRGGVADLAVCVIAPGARAAGRRVAGDRLTGPRTPTRIACSACPDE